MSETFSGTYKGWNLTQKSTTAYHSQTNFTEIVNLRLDMALQPWDVAPDTSMYNNISQL